MRTYYASCEKQQSESLWLNTLQCIYSCEAEWTEFWPYRDCWCFTRRLLAHRINRISEIFVGCAVKKGCPRYLDHAKTVSQSARLEKTYSEKANWQNNEFIKWTQRANTFVPQAATTDRCAAPYNHMKNNPVGVLLGRPLHKEEMAIHVAVNLSSAGLCCAMLYYVYDLALRAVLCHPHPML